jgi:hypothetical protein
VIARIFADMGTGPGALLVLLLAGHVLGDFLFQTEWMAREKEKRWGPLLLHSVVVLFVHAAVLAPFLTSRLAAGLLFLAAAHLLFDALRIRAFGVWGASLGAFILDQTLHVLAALALWGVLASPTGFSTVRWIPSAEWVAWYARWLGVAAGYVFVTVGGSRIVRGVLERFPEAVPNENTDGREYAMGHVIGYLERLIALTLVLFGQWAALGLIVAAKSIARFPEFNDPKHKDFAEYYLLGTLASILVAVAAGVLLRLLLG